MANTRKTTEQEKQILTYLNRLQKSGETNMFGAGPYVAEKFDLSKQDARIFLSLWMDNYSEEANYETVKIK